VLIDGNEATGTLHLNFTAARPSIGGTLALKSLDLGRYFPSQTASLPGSTGSAWNCLLATDLSLPLLQHFDADLRLSADKVVLGRLQLGRSAATVMVSQGRMLADLGAFEFDGGRGSGQLSADMTGSMPRLTLRGRLEEVDAQRLSASMFGHSVLTGRTDTGAFILDNQVAEILPWADTGYRFVKRQSQADPSIWIALGDQRPTPFVAAR
jgi:uncharacterized protein involved in outer membrane biogenesis